MEGVSADNGSRSDSAEGNLYSLFVCEDYVEKSWTFGELTQPLLCSNMSTTDFDLTGQIVWPACVLLSWFIYWKNKDFQGKVVVELGAGCGLGGFVAANYAKKVIITDGNDVVMSLINKNKVHLKSENVVPLKLLWGIHSEVENTLTTDENNDAVYPDVIIGADVILWPNQVVNLLYTLRWMLLKKRSSAVCYISYIVRAHTTTDLLYSHAERLGLVIATVPIENFVPEDCHDFDALEKRLLCISIADNYVEDASDMNDSPELNLMTAAMPC
jgi:predicted nicotinamide N-methyase